ncbi:LysR family transcriptional regulator [Candidatus Enterococcus ferrettii]|uniref:HTH lysR-type domain-containing protein n=1 Tax=Candidatus Enterococcus ferrettii TaxID=2815324 RepID=A0ABV0ELP4_9ENTE|nr:LysR family transcriptional regulator [Enterococcus sp. 665A]MBO1342654.1 LysR family transcriptional regulator [Enterococcus sp. 665A]
MELTHINYFLCLSKHKQFTAAAECLGISQAALSKQIKNLESELSIKLFDRNLNSCELTDAGKILKKHVLAVHRELASMKEELIDINDPTTKLPLKVAINLDDLEYRMKTAICQLLLSDPHQNIRGVATANIFDAIENLTADIGISISDLDTPKSITELPITEENYVFIYSTTHPLNQKEFSLDALRQYPYISLSSDSIEQTNLSNWIAQNIDETSIINAIHLNSIELILAMIEQTEGFAIVPDYLISKFENRSLTFKRWHTLPTRKISIYYLKNKYLRNNIKRVLNYFLPK